MVRQGEVRSDGRLLSFRIADQSFSVPAAEVRGVIRRPPITRVPNAPATLTGLMNFHGSAIPVVGLGALLGIKLEQSSSTERVIVFGEEPSVGLLVDDVLRVENATGSRRSAKPLDIPELLAAGFSAPPVDRVKVAKLDVDERAAPVAAEASSPLLTFRVAGQRYALPLAAVNEAMTLPRKVAVYPRADVTVLGMLEVRDRVLPLISLAGLLGLKETAERRNVLVTIHGERRIGLVVGAIDGVSRVPLSAVEDVPPVLQRGDGDAEIEAIARVGGHDPLISILSPAKLFGNHDVAGAIGPQESSRSTEMLKADRLDNSLQFVIFQLGNDSYGLPIAAVDEIALLPDALTRVPKAPDFVAGLMNLRGRVLPVVDQRVRFRAGEQQNSGRPRVIVVSIGDLQAGFIVDGVSEILRVPETAIARAPTMPGDGTRLFDRIAPAAVDGEMILVIDPKELLDRAERDLLVKFRTDAAK